MLPRDNDCFSGLLTECANRPLRERLPVRANLQPGQTLNQRMVRATPRLALWNEIAMLL